jgi:hypothetical protein
MEAVGLITDLWKRGIRLSLDGEDGDKLWVEPASRLTDEDRRAIRSLKPELMRMLRADVLPDPDRIIPEQPVIAELMRVLPDLDRHAWPKEVQQSLQARIWPGDRIVNVTDDSLLVSARPPRECYRVWRNDA